MVNHAPWLDHDPGNQLLQCFEFHDKHGRNRRKERICFDHELVRDQNKCVLSAMRPCCHENSKHWASISRKSILGLRLILYDYYSIRMVIMDPPVPGPFKGPGTGRSQITISLKPT